MFVPLIAARVEEGHEKASGWIESLDKSAFG